MLIFSWFWILCSLFFLSIGLEFGGWPHRHVVTLLYICSVGLTLPNSWGCLLSTLRRDTPWGTSTLLLSSRLSLLLASGGELGEKASPSLAVTSSPALRCILPCSPALEHFHCTLLSVWRGRWGLTCEFSAPQVWRVLLWAVLWRSHCVALSVPPDHIIWEAWVLVWMPMPCPTWGKFSTTNALRGFYPDPELSLHALTQLSEAFMAAHTHWASWSFYPLCLIVTFWKASLHTKFFSLFDLVGTFD